MLLRFCGCCWGSAGAADVDVAGAVDAAEIAGGCLGGSAAAVQLL